MNQPNTPTYDISELATVSIYTRDSYMKEFGKDAPPFDITLPLKNWLDKQAVADLAAGADGEEYLQFSVLSEGKYKPFYCTRQYAAMLNLKPAVTAATVLDSATAIAIARPYLPFPARPLADNEQLSRLLTGQWIVQRVDLQPASTTGADVKMLAEVLTIVKAIAAKLGI